MEKVVLALGLLTYIHTVGAACDPVKVSGQVSMACSSKQITYIINIYTLKSPKECLGSDMHFSKEAIVAIHAPKVEVEIIKVEDSDFSYTLTSQGGTFTSLVNGLKLSKCNVLPGGGISIGN